MDEKNKKGGFTLIELLAVIVILAIILLIAIPIVGNVIENARVGAFKVSTSNIVRSAEHAYMREMYNNNDTKRLEFYYEEKVETSNKEDVKLNYKGEKPDSGVVLVNGKGNVSITLYNSKYKLCAYKKYNEDEVKVERNVTKENCDENISGPKIEIIGENPLLLEIIIGETYTLENEYIAYTSEGEITDNVKIYVDSVLVNIIDRSILNKEYEVIYKVIDGDLFKEVKRKVKIVDTTPPVIEVPENIVLKTSEVLNYNLREGVTVIDNSGEELDFEVLSELTPTPGNYIITYISTDGSGNKTEKIRQIEVIESIVSKQTIVTFEELLEGRSRSQKINIENLTEIENVTVNTGNVSYSLNGNEVTINVSNGSSTRTITNPTKYSKSATSYTTSGTDSFSYSKSYSDGEGYSGTLTKNGSSYVSSGSYTPADSKVVTDSRYLHAYTTKRWNGSEWVNAGTYDPTPSSLSYNSGGYSGTLNFVDWTGHSHVFNTAPSNPVIGQIYRDWESWAYANYSGTVTKPASDTRIYRQNYDGVVYKSSFDNYYAYTVTINYKINE